ncbi:MAG: tetratricopeptide repeat protein [Candidatus Rifleibacteriota bacterium]
MANLNNVYAQRHYETAIDLFEQGQYDKALAQIDKAIQKNPQNPDYYSTRGVFLHRMNDPIRAIEAYQDALRVSPDHCFSHYNLGLIYMRQNKILQAISEWESVIKVKPRDVDAIFNIAVALSHLGKSKQAVPFYEKVIQIQPTHVQAHQNLGVIYRDQGDFTKAKFHLNKLRELDSTYIEVVETEILKCEEQEFLAELEKKKQSFKESQLEDHGDLSMALMAIIEENFEKAFEIVQHCLQQTPEDIQAQIILGQAQAGLSKTSDAIATFMRITAEHPENADASFHLGNIFLGLGELEKALDYFTRVSRLAPDYPFISENISSIRKKLTLKDDE